MFFLLINQWKDHKKNLHCVVFQTTEFPEQYKGIIIIFTSTSLPVVTRFWKNTTVFKMLGEKGKFSNCNEDNEGSKLKKSQTIKSKSKKDLEGCLNTSAYWLYCIYNLSKSP